jgi:imidazolonepropionase-like amidohydrolase
LIVTGDGRTEPFRGSVVIEGTRLAAVDPDDYAGGPEDDVIELSGRLVMPGAIDPHAHALAPGPRFASGTPGISTEEALGNLRRHLTQGHTTVVDADGFKIPDETDITRRAQPVRVEASTVHFAPMFAAADAADGSGLQDIHRQMTAEAMKATGVVVIGEVGAGMTLGGGGQDYLYIPAAVEKATGVRIRPAQATELKYAVLGRHVKPGTADRQRIATLIAEFGLPDPISVDDLVEVVESSVLPSIEPALEGVVESARVATALNIPAIVHNAAASEEACREAAGIAGPLLIAGHTNHSTFTIGEAVESAAWMKAHGAYVEVDTFDAWGRRELDPRPAHLLAIVAAGTADIFATDYAAGHWDGIFEAVEDVTRAGLTTLAQAVAMATGNVGKAIPGIGATRGLLKAGFLADLVISNARHPSEVEAVFIDGKPALLRGALGEAGVRRGT